MFPQGKKEREGDEHLETVNALALAYTTILCCVNTVKGGGGGGAPLSPFGGNTGLFINKIICIACIGVSVCVCLCINLCYSLRCGT